MDDLNSLLEQLKTKTLRSHFIIEEVLSILLQLLLWLNESENNTDSNCKKIDFFVTHEIVIDREFNRIPEDIKNILFDIGGSLSDTYSSPEVALDFNSTPKQLLERVQSLLANLK